MLGDFILPICLFFSAIFESTVRDGEQRVDVSENCLESSKKIDGPVLLNAHYAFLREFGHTEDKF